MTQPLAIDLFCGLGGWTEGLLAEGYRVIGFDNQRHCYGDARYPAPLVMQDVLTLHGSQFKDAALIVASPPCQAYSYMAMPWKRAKAIAADYQSGKRDRAKLTALFDACFRIQREACEAAGRHIPLVVENVCGAQKWVGKARWHYGSFYLWGDVPALMPFTRKAQMKSDIVSVRHLGCTNFHQSQERRATKNDGGSWFAVAHNTTSGKGQNPDGRLKQPYEDAGILDGLGRYIDPASPVAQLTERDVLDAVKNGGDGFGSGANCSLQRRQSSKSTARQAASAQIAKIPRPLAQWIARAWWPAAAAIRPDP